MNTRQRGFDKKIQPLVNRFETSSDATIRNVVARILKDVQINGDDALFKYTKKFDRLDLTSKNVRLTEKHFKNASEEVSPRLKSAIKTAYKNIKSFHKEQVEKSWFVKKGSSRLGQMIRPLERVGLYVPGGTASYPSSVLMNAIPALVAGVKEIIICSPAPGGVINSAVLYAASLCGVKEFYAVGGAQAVAAMAFGTKSIKRVDKIVGPGNVYVAEAKRAVFGRVDIDMTAGPSEICIIADSGAKAAWCAADILSQAEHDEMAWLVLLTTSARLIEETKKEIDKQLSFLPRADIARKCIKNRFYAIECRSIGEAIKLANAIAPEHLELVFKNAASKLNVIENAGAIFVGHYSPEALGDYMAGPNHVLPTSGSARFFSPLGVYDFQKRLSVIQYSKKDFLQVAQKVALFAEAEGLDAHAAAARIRISDKR